MSVWIYIRLMLEVRNLKLAFRSDGDPKTVLYDLNFSIEKGKTLAIVGESGSGKTVTSLLLMGLIPVPSIASKSGSIKIETPEGIIDILTTDAETIRKLRGKQIAMIFQEPMTALNPSFTCGGQLLESIKLHHHFNSRESDQKAAQLLEEVGLKDTRRILGSYPHQLSGGQRQRVMIAMALAGDPALLIADEPTTALDVTVQAEILRLLKKLQISRNMAMIFISHDLSVVSKIADDILVLYRGNQAEYGPASKVFSSPEHPYTKALLLCRPSGHSRNHYLPTVSDIMENKDGELIQKDFIHQPLEKSQKQGLLVEVSELEVTYRSGGLFGKPKSNKVVHSVSFTINKGESLGLVGESGSGKTTIGRSVVRLIKPSGGEIHFTDSKKSFSRVAQIIFQDPFASLNPRIKIGDAILEPMHVHDLGKRSERKEKVISLLNEVGLDPVHYNSYPHELSGGQRQRACIARCLALEPELIVCDESVAALDVSVQAQVLNLLKKLQARLGLTYLFISHDLNVIRYMCEKIMVLKHGEVVESADSETLFANPTHPYTKELLGNIS